MAILQGDIKLLKSQVLLDTVDGGGQMTHIEVTDGESNNLFPDVSELDRAYGRISLRKVFPAVITTDTDSYYGSHAIITKAPVDPNVSVVLFSTEDWFDTRDAAKNRVEQYMAPSQRWAGHLLETQVSGARAIQMVVPTGGVIPDVGQTLYLVENEGLGNEFYQYVRVSRVTTEDTEFTESYAVAQASKFWAQTVTVELTGALRYSFHGKAPTQLSGSQYSSLGLVRDTLVADASKYYGISKLTLPVTTGDSAAKVSSIFGSLVPNTQTEVPLVGLTASGTSSVAVASGTTSITLSYSSILNSTTSLYLGTGCLPGTLSITVGSTTLTDAAGLLVSAGQTIGTVNYSSGVVIVTTGSFTGTKTVTFSPAGFPLRNYQSSSMPIVGNDRGYSYVMTLLPTPQKLGVQVSYKTQGKWYTLYDTGPQAGGSQGVLSGFDPAVGTGTVNYGTGAVSVTLGSLPDPDSTIIFAWATNAEYQNRGNSTVLKAKVNIAVAMPNGQVYPGTTTVTWPDPDGTGTVSVTDNGDGVLTGTGGTGTIRYNTGEIKLIPTNLPLGGTQYTVTYSDGVKEEATFAHPQRDINGDLNVTIAGGNLIPGTVEVEWNTLIDTTEYISLVPAELQLARPRDPTQIFLDDGLGDLTGYPALKADLNYTTGAIRISPDSTSVVPKPRWNVTQIGFQATPIALSGFAALIGIRGAPIYRNTFRGYDYVSVGCRYPDDETGYVTIRYFSTNSPSAHTEVFSAANLYVDLTEGFDEKVISGSVNLTFGSRTYVDNLGTMYHTIDRTTGEGTLGGSINYTTGELAITSWLANSPNSLVRNSMLTQLGAEPSDYCLFRIPITPIRTGTFQIRGTKTGGGTFNIQADSNGVISGTNVKGNIDYLNGIVELRFGDSVTAAGNELMPWYDAAAVSNGMIFKPSPVYTDTLVYDAVGFSYLPLDADILGLDPIRLPPDGRVPIYRLGDIVVLHNTQSYLLNTPAISSTYNVGRVRCASIKVVDTNGLQLPTNMYTADLDAGTLVLTGSFSTVGYNTPLYAEHRIEDMALASDVQITGQLAFTRTITHDYPANTSYASSALIIGDMQARAYNMFSQAAWTTVWSDLRSGADTTGSYNLVQYPIVVTNTSSIQERWAVIFDSATSYRVVGESVGQIVTGQAITNTCAPINPASGTPYFTLQALGFGGGWSAGNVIRFNTVGANYPVWIARTVQQGNPTTLSDSFQLQVRGDVNT